LVPIAYLILSNSVKPTNGLKENEFHDLRHTSASLMLNNGVDVLVASGRLGHAKPSITLDVCGHLLSSAQDEVADKMDSILTI